MWALGRSQRLAHGLSHTAARVSGTVSKSNVRLTKSHDWIRHFSAPPTFVPEPPEGLNVDMAEGIQDSTLFYLRHGVSNQRLLELAATETSEEVSVVTKWQRMMEIYLSTQVYVISGLGYRGDEQGLRMYTEHLGAFMQDKCDHEERESFRKVASETWKELLSMAFELDLADIKSISIVEARNVMHKVSSKMQEPAILMKIEQQCSQLESNVDLEVEMAQKHQILQHVIVEDVYLGGNPCLVEEAGFGTGEKGYAHMQCVMAEHESDPLCAQYASAAMFKIWQAAGLDLSALASGGKLPGSI